MIPVSKLQHPKEQVYFIIMAVVSVLLWLVILSFIYFLDRFSPMAILASVMGMHPAYNEYEDFMMVFTIVSWAFNIGIILLIYYWYYLRYKARLYGDAIKVNYNQFPELYTFIEFTSKKLGVETPECFILADNQISGFAQRVFLKRYILLNSTIVDAISKKGKDNEIKWLIAYHIGHHAAGHLNPLKSFLIGPAVIIPFLNKAYRRACVLTADRIGTYITGDINDGKKALSLIALASIELRDEINYQAFREQENEIPQIPAFINKLSSQFPRTTVRLIELDKFKVELEFLKQYEQFGNQNQHLNAGNGSPVVAPPLFQPLSPQQIRFCHACGVKNRAEDRYCAECGILSI
ncbi:hypothetical protein BH09BAC1_BH09BAC1_02850 [soil metagenome]